MKTLGVKYVNTCIRNTVESIKSDNKTTDALLTGYIKWYYFQLTHVEMSKAQEDYIEYKIGSNQAWKILHTLKDLAKKNGIHDIAESEA